MKPKTAIALQLSSFILGTIAATAILVVAGLHDRSDIPSAQSGPAQCTACGPDQTARPARR